MINFNYDNHAEKDKAALNINDANIIDIIESAQYYIACVIAIAERYAPDEEELAKLMGFLTDRIIYVFENDPENVEINVKQDTDKEGFDEAINMVTEKLGGKVEK